MLGCVPKAADVGAGLEIILYRTREGQETEVPAVLMLEGQSRGGGTFLVYG